MKRQTALLFYLISIYVFVQFGWWAYHLIDVTSEINTPEAQRKQIIMILGEGMVFFLLLLFGLWKIRASIQKEMRITNRQSNFLLSVTHELKTPIASVKLYLQTLLKRNTLNREQQEQLLKSAIEENLRLEGMIENILTATQIENKYLNLNLEKCNLSQELTKMTDSWGEIRVPVDLDIEENIIAQLDLSIIEIVLHNLLDNAYKYGGTPPNIEVYLKKDRDKIIWGIKDNGSGVPLESRKDIFDKFVRIGNEETRKQKGTGLGLFIVKSLLSLHGSTITYLPNTPNGSDFRITHPIKA